MSTPVLLICTTPTEKDAQDISSALIENKLAACVQLSQVNSMYWWDNKVQRRPEYLMHIKTISKNFNAIEKIIDELHPYELPALEMITIDGGKERFLDWIKDSVS